MSLGAASAGLGRSWRGAPHPCRGGKPELPSDQGRGRTDPLLWSRPVLRFHLRPFGCPVSLCLFLSLLGHFGFCVCSIQSSHPLPLLHPNLIPAPQFPLLSLLLSAGFLQCSLPPSFLTPKSMLGLQVSGTGVNFSLPFVISSPVGPYQPLCERAPRSGTSELPCCLGRSSSF